MKSGPGYRGRSAFGTTHVGCTRLSLYGGYRFTAFDQIEIETVDGTNYFPDNSPTDVDADNAYVGLKFTIVLQSDKEKARDFNKDD